MRSRVRRLAQTLLLGTLLLLGQTGISNAAHPVDTSSAVPATAQQTPPAGTLSVVPPIVSLTVAPGATATADLTIHSGVLEKISLQAQGLGQSPDGSFTYVAADKDASAYSARSMLSVSPTSLQMQPGDDQKITVSVSVPRDAGAGTRYALIRITGTPGTGDQNVGLGVELGVPALISLANTTASHLGSVEGLTVDAAGGQPLVVDGQIRNTGNTHYGAAPNQVNADATLFDASNKQIAEGRTVLTGNSIVPTFSRDFKVSLAATKNLAAGHYRVQVTAKLQDGTLLGTAALAFDISGGAVEGATYTPAQDSTQNGGSDGSLLIVALLGGVIGGALLMGLVAVWARRKAAGSAA